MPQLEVFGLSLTVRGNAILQPNAPHLDVYRWNATFSGNRATMDVGVNIGADASLDINIAFTTRPDNNGILFPADGLQPAPHHFQLRSDAVPIHSNAPIVLEIGGLSFSTPTMPSNALTGAGGELVIQLVGASRRWFRGAEKCGLTVDYGVAGARLDLGSTRLRFNEGFLKASCGVHLDLGASYEMTVLSRPHSSQPIDLPIGAPSTRSFEFAPTSNDALVLQSELATEGKDVGEGNPAIAGAGVKDYYLQAIFGPSDSANPRLTRLATVPSGSTQTLIGYFHQTDLNTPVNWTTSGPIELHLRPADGPQRPSSLLIAPTSGNGVSLQRAKAEPVHGLVARTSFVVPARTFLRCRLRDAGTPLSGIEASITSSATLPYMGHSNASRLYTPYPGEAFTGRGVDVEQLEFTGTGGAIPILPAALVRAEAHTRQTFLQELDASWQSHTYDLETLIHETAFEQGPDASTPVVSPQEIFRDRIPSFKQVGSPAIDMPERIRISSHILVRDYGIGKFKPPTEPDDNPDYVLIRQESDIEALDEIYLEPKRPEFKLSGLPRSTDDRPLGIIKLTDVYTLAEIFQREKLRTKFSDNANIDLFTHILDPMVRDRGWRGVILFDIKVDYSKFTILQALMKEELRLRYVAFTARYPGSFTAGEDISISARVFYTNTSVVEETKQNDAEVKFRVEHVDAAWFDSRLSFSCRSRAYFHGSFGLEYGKLKTAPNLQIIGSYDREVFRFVSELSRPLAILDPDNGFGPLKQVWLEGAEIVESPKGVSIDLNGEIEPRSVSWGEGSWLDVPAGRLIRFRKLSLRLPRLEGDMPIGFRWLKINYPSIEINLEQNHFRLFSAEALQLKLMSLGVSWDNAFDWNALLPIYGGFTNTSAQFTFLMTLRLHLMKLPELFDGSLKDLLFDFVVGLRSIGGFWSSDNIKIALSAVGFDHLDLRLLRFLEVHADNVILERKTLPDGTAISWFSLTNVEIRILGRTVVKNLTSAVFTTPDGQRGFFAFLADPFPNGLLTVDWALIGQNISIDENLAKALIRVGTQDPADVQTLIKDNSTPEKFLPTFGGANRQAIGDWIFAGGLTIAGGLLSGKFLFQDKAYYGIAFKGDLLKEWFGYDLELSVLYIKRPRAEEDSFYIAFTVPAVNIGTVSFTGGVVALEIAMNGSMMIDIGFPWRLEDGARAWNRTLGAIVTPFQGSGGFYLAKRSAVTQQTRQILRLSGGYAMQVGLGATFGGGVFTVWVRAGVTAVLEGDALLQGNNLAGLRISGAVGILVEGHGELNWWIVSASVHVIATAEAMTTLTYGLDPDTLQPFPDGSRMRVQLDFNLCARASASACIGSGMFSYCRDISVSIGMPFRQTISVG